MISDTIQQQKSFRSSVLAGFAVFVLAMAFFVIRVLIDKRVRNRDMFDDYFHGGEWFLANINRLAEVPFQTITIHGGKDLWPAMVLHWLYGFPDYITVSVSVYEVLIPIVAGLTILGMAWYVAPQGRAVLFLVPFAVCAGTMIDHRDNGILIFIAALVVFLSGRARPTHLAMILFAAAIVFSATYSMNRGAITLVVAAAVIAWLAVQDRRYVLVAVYSAAIWFGLGLVLPLLGPLHVLENILFLVDTADVEPAPFVLWRQAYLLGAFAIVLALNLIQFLAGPRSLQAQGRIIALMLLAAGFFKIGANPVDWPYFGTAILFLMLGLIHWWGWFSENGAKKRMIEILLLGVLVLGAIAMAITEPVTTAWQTVAWYGFTVGQIGLLALAVGAFGGARYALGTVQGWVRPAAETVATLALVLLVMRVLIGFQSHIESGRLAGYFSSDHFVDMATPKPDIVWVREHLERTGAACIYDMTASGMLNAHANLPTCTRIGYIFYADATYEDELIADLVRSDPPMVVYTSTYAWNEFFGVTMLERFSSLAALVRETYPVERCFDTYCLRFKSDETAGL